MEMNCAMCVIRGRSAQRLHTEAGTNICHHCQLTHSSMEVFIFKLLTTLSTETASHTALAILPPLTWYDKKKKKKDIVQCEQDNGCHGEKSSLAGSDEKQQPKHNGLATMLRGRGHTRATNSDQCCLLLFELRGE